jgi:hypothetical protein
MRLITQAEFDALPVVNGRRRCPCNTDYSAVKPGSYCKFGLDCEFGSYCKFGSHCKFGDDCEFGSYCEFGLDCEFGSYCKFGSHCKFGDDCTACSPYWPYLHPPPFETTGPILPTSDQRAHWSERLGIELTGCYTEIAEQLAGRWTELLARTYWSQCERRIVESWAEAARNE